MNLYTLTGDYLDAVAAYEAAETPEDQEAALVALDGIECAIEDKANAYARIMRNAEAEAASYGDEIKRLTGCKRRAEALAGRMKTGMLAAMQATGAPKIQTEIGTWTRRLNPYSVQVLDVDAVPERFLIQQAPTVDKRAMLAEFKETGEIFEGVQFARSESVSLK